MTEYLEINIKLKPYSLLAISLFLSITNSVSAQRVPKPISEYKTLRKDDSIRVAFAIKEANEIINSHPKNITKSQQHRFESAADQLISWTNNYLVFRFYSQASQDDITLRIFKHYVIAGRYYEWAGLYSQALHNYDEATYKISADNPLRKKASRYENELAAAYERLLGHGAAAEYVYKNNVRISATLGRDPHPAPKKLAGNDSVLTGKKHPPLPPKTDDDEP